MAHPVRAGAIALLLLSAATAAAAATRVTILTDAFGSRADLKKDWGFAALVEHDDLRILFDTGNDAALFRHNVETLKIDLTRLDFVVISHRHGDHTDGLRYLLAINPKARIYTPADEYFGGPTPPAFFLRPMESLPPHMRYFDGALPASIPHGTAWAEANFERVTGARQLRPGIQLVSNLSRGAAFTETPELSLLIDTPEGRLLVVGCSHPGIEQILESADARQRPIRLLVGGLHLVTTADAEVERLALALRDGWKVGSVAPGHCTGEVAFATLQRVYGPRYVYAGLGSTLRLTPEP